MTDIIQWAATLSGIAGAILIAGKFPGRISGWGFLVMVASSIAWLAFAAFKGEAPLAIQNVVMLLVNLFGVYRHLIRREDESAGTGKRRARSA